jgi:hypothetical protein
MDTDRLQYKIDRIQSLLNATIEISAQYENGALQAAIVEIGKELEYLENMIQLLEDY